MNTHAIGENICSRMRQKDITQRELASRVGLTEVTMSRYINGLRQPTAYALYRISRALGCKMEDLMRGVEGEEK